MRSQNVVLMMIALLLTMSVPFFIAKNLQLGTYAKSPQEVKVSLGQSALVGGGRAKLWYIGGDTGGDFELKCKSGAERFQPERGEQYEACGVTVELIEVVDGGARAPQATYKVTWKE